MSAWRMLARLSSPTYQPRTGRHNVGATQTAIGRRTYTPRVSRADTRPSLRRLRRRRLF